MNTLAPPSFESISRARTQIQSLAIESPLLRMHGGNLPSNVQVFFKCEQFQPLGSFKCRAAANALAELEQDKLIDLKHRGVCTVSAGNFGQGLAWCCAQRGIRCTIVAPLQTPRTKLQAMKELGADIIQTDYETWWTMLETRSPPREAPEAVFIHPGSETSVLAGNATIALEILEQLPEANLIVSPWGSGALATGIAFGVQGHPQHRDIQVIAVEPETASPLKRSIDEKTPIKLPPDEWRASFVDGCGAKAVLPEIWNVAQIPFQAKILKNTVVTLDAVAEAIRLLSLQNGMIVEGAGACALAAVISGQCDKFLKPWPHVNKIVCVVSGRGIDTDRLIQVLRHDRELFLPPVEESHDARLLRLGHQLPVPPTAKGLYVPAVISGQHVYLSGHGPAVPDGLSYVRGRVGQQMNIEQAKDAARLTALACLSTLRATLGGSLNRVVRVVKVLGMVNGVAEMKQLECVEVINGFSQVLVDVFGSTKGVGARSAVIVQGLPMNIPVEVEAVFEIMS